MAEIVARPPIEVSRAGIRDKVNAFLGSHPSEPIRRAWTSQTGNGIRGLHQNTKDAIKFGIALAYAAPTHAEALAQAKAYVAGKEDHVDPVLKRHVGRKIAAINGVDEPIPGLEDLPYEPNIGTRKTVAMYIAELQLLRGLDKYAAKMPGVPATPDTPAIPDVIGTVDQLAFVRGLVNMTIDGMGHDLIKPWAK